MSFEDFVNSVKDLELVEDAQSYEVLIEKRVDIKSRYEEDDATTVEDIAENFPDVSHVRTKEFEDGKILTYSVEREDEPEPSQQLKGSGD